MPASDSLRTYHQLTKQPTLTIPEPPLSPAERKIVKSYGGWTMFMQSFGLKPWNDEDTQEGKQIAASFAAEDEDESN